MTTLMLLAMLQEAAGPRPFRAGITVESWSFRGDASEADKARLWVRPGEALRYEEGRRTLVVKDGRASSRERGSRTVRAWDAARADRFSPVDLWRMNPAEAARRFESPEEPAPERPALPEAVLDREGRARAPLRIVRLPWARTAGDGEDRAEGCARVLLVPRDPALRERFPAIRLSVERATGRLLRITARGPAGETAWTLDGLEEVDGLEDGLFELEGPGTKTEES